MLHLPFADRLEAGRFLAGELALRKVAQDEVVLALTRGGVPVGFSVAERLHLPLDVVVVRKLAVPWQPELAMGAIAGPELILDDRMLKQLEITVDDLEEVIAREEGEMGHREALYRGGGPAPGLRDKSVILVDDGIVTGNTMLVAIRHTRRLKPSRVIVAVPVGSEKACGRLRDEADDFVCLAVPRLFFAIGEWYREFPQVTDTEVQNLLAESRRQLRKHFASVAAA